MSGQTSSYLRRVRRLRPELLKVLRGERRLLDAETQAELDREVNILKALIRCEREAFEDQTGRLVDVEDTVIPRADLQTLLIQ